MKKLPILLLFAAVAVSSLTIGCRDESDPEYWLDQMHERLWREKSLKTLNEIFNTAMQENGSDLKNEKVKKLVDVMVPKLMEGFKAFDRDRDNRTEIIKLLAQMKDERAIPVFMEGLDLENTTDANVFQVSATALRRQSVEAALPKLLSAHTSVTAARTARRGAPFTNPENEIEQAVISASSYILAKKRNSAHKAKVVKMLSDIVETSDEFQELRLNMKALKGLGRIGDPAGIPALIKGIAMKGKRQPIGLGQIAFAALQQVHDRDAVVDAVLAFAVGKDASFNLYYKEELVKDPLMKNPMWPKQEAMTFFGMLNYSSPKVIEFLTGELNHTEPDEMDEAVAKMELQINFEPDGWTVMRRNWAAVALGKLAYKPLVGVLKERMTFKKGKLELKPEEAVGYVQAFGLLLYPEETCDILLKVGKSADDSMRDKVYYNASIMCGTPFVKPMKKSIKKINCDDIVSERLGDSPSEADEKQARNECDIMKKRIQGYIDRIEFGKTCGKDLACYSKALEDKGSANAERAIFTMYRIGRDDPAQRDKVVEVLTEKLGNPSKMAMTANIFALDRLTPKGSDKLVKRIQKLWKEFSRQSTYKDRARMLESFIGHVRNRGR